MQFIALFTFIVIFTGSALAQSPNGDSRRILSLTEWRVQQVTDAQNRVVRLSNRLTQMRAKTGNINEINKLENDRKMAAHSAELVGDFKIEEYFDMYLAQFATSEADLVRIAKGMSQSEVAQLLKMMLKRSATSTGDNTSPVLSTTPYQAAGSGT